ncbi:MAG TPA: NAD(P)/FAD-dependent oxidoreductase [Thermoanaerobaculia bacterium]|nr:NAD(P)/FAD-dependent oxidoreductase [Thermoanaerobaculia bacterium]
MKFDAIVIGAGVAGLAAARELSGARKRVCIVEARERTGGRIHTLHVADLPLPIELGAEMIHGEPQETFSIVEAAALIACQLPDNHLWSVDGKWERIPDFWQQIEKIRKQIGRLRRDMSFDAFLRTRRGIPPRLRKMARDFVEGYHAAHADRISAMWLRPSDDEEEESLGNPQFRILNGYDALTEWLRAGLDPDRTDLRLGTAVKRVVWRAGDVAIDCVREKREETLHAPAAIITIPIGVWKAPREQEGAIGFDPALDEKMRAVAKLEVGHVVKMMFRFRERFWDEVRLDSGATPPNFVHSSDRFMPTWWSAAPVRAPILTGWAGGHAADALLAEGDEAMIDRALDSLAKTFGMRRRTVDDQLAGTYTHNWQSDLFSRGAYSYAAVGGTGAHQTLARPLRSTLFFAGEATSSDQTGTVAGAIATGRRAARELLKG